MLKTFGGKEEEERRCDQVWLSLKKYLRRSSSQVYRGNAKIWPNHRFMRAVLKSKMMKKMMMKILKMMKKMMVLMMVLLQSLLHLLDRTDEEMWRLGSMRYMRWIYLPEVLWQERHFNRWWFFFVAFASDHKSYGQIFIQLFTRTLNYAMELSTFIESLPISTYWLNIFQFFWRSTFQKFKLRCSFTGDTRMASTLRGECGIRQKWDVIGRRGVGS